MKRKRFTEAQIAFALRQEEAAQKPVAAKILRGCIAGGFAVGLASAGK